MRLATNLQVAQRNAQAWAISARGFNTELSNKLLVLMDGRTVYSPLFSGVFWDAQDYVLDDLDRIEVISGPGSALWGANAVNGVINITTKSAKDTQGLYTEVSTGTELENITSARYGLTLAPNVYLRVYGKYTERDGGAFSNGADASTDWNSRRAGFRLDAEPQRGPQRRQPAGPLDPHARKRLRDEPSGVLRPHPPLPAGAAEYFLTGRRPADGRSRYLRRGFPTPTLRR